MNIDLLNNDFITKYQHTTMTAIMTGIVLLVSLAWNDFIKYFINKYFPVKDDNTLRGKFVYAVVITFIVILLEIYLFSAINPEYKF